MPLAFMAATLLWPVPLLPLMMAPAWPMRRPGGAVRLLTHLRYAGYSFNPVSFYYCHAADGALHSIVAEITNTPWGERHCYVLPASGNEGTPSKMRFRFGKDFHVSPFLPMDMNYDWRFSPPASRLLVHMESWRDGEHVFDATMTLDRRCGRDPGAVRSGRRDRTRPCSHGRGQGSHLVRAR